MIGIVGVGPRTGTSFVMRRIKEHGFPIIGEAHVEGWTSPVNNPQGHFDLAPQDLIQGLLDESFTDRVLKVWPPMLHIATGLERIVVLERRDRLAQLASIERCINNELMENDHPDFNIKPDELLSTSINALDAWLDTRPQVSYIHAYTEDLDQRIDDIITFIGESKWQQSH